MGTTLLLGRGGTGGAGGMGARGYCVVLM